MNELVTRGHLGGYIKGGDEATWYPDLWRWFSEGLHVGSVLDIGCGEGQAVDFFRACGISAVGVDGVPQESPFIVEHDFTTGPLEPATGQRFDLCWSCEFVEHVQEEYAPNFLKAFALCDVVAMTHADPGQGGYHHVNCRPEEYWIAKVEDVGFRLHRGLTVCARTIASINTSPWNHFRRSGLVFVKESELERVSAGIRHAFWTAAVNPRLWRGCAGASARRMGRRVKARLRAL